MELNIITPHHRKELQLGYPFFWDKAQRPVPEERERHLHRCEDVKTRTQPVSSASVLFSNGEESKENQ
jgi:hypothetical protein